MNQSLLECLIDTVPPWFEITARAEPLLGVARLELAGAAEDFVIHLQISAGGGELEVKEPEAKLLPAFCPERHVNSDGTFCIGLDAGKVQTPDEVLVWWGLLRCFLVLQRAATRSRVWPTGHGLAHGNAGKHHRNALEIADRLGIGSDYRSYVSGQPQATIERLKSAAAGQGKLLRGRFPCPVGCPDPRGGIRQRRDCCSRAEVLELASQDRKRLELEAEFWRSVIEKGRSCCGTLDECPLRKNASKDEAVSSPT